MAKKVVASLKTGAGKAFTKCIKMTNQINPVHISSKKRSFIMIT